MTKVPIAVMTGRSASAAPALRRSSAIRVSASSWKPVCQAWTAGETRARVWTVLTRPCSRSSWSYGPQEPVVEWPVGDGRVLGEGFGQQAVQDGDEQVVLVAEVPVDRVDGDAGVLGDLAHGRRLVAVVDEQPLGGGEDLLAFLLAVSGASVPGHPHTLS